MTTRTFTTKSGTIFEWEETPETIEALKQLHETVRTANENATNTKSTNVV